MSKKQQKGQGKGTGKKQQYVDSVPLWKLFLKAQVRSYADVDGSILLTAGADPKEYYTSAGCKDAVLPNSNQVLG